MIFNDDDHFTLANIPFGVASRQGQDSKPQIATRLRDHVYFISDLVNSKQTDLPDHVRSPLAQVSSINNMDLDMLNKCDSQP